MKKCIQWVGKHPGAMAALAFVLNFGFAAQNFERGGYWLLVSALHMGLAVLAVHSYLKMREALRRLNAEHESVMLMLDELERRYAKGDPNDWRYS